MTTLLGIGRALGMPIEARDIAAVAANAPTGTLAYADGLSSAKEALYSSFPAGLKQREGA